MLDSLKRLTKHSAVYGISHIVTRSVGFLLLPLYTNTFERAEYGVAALVFTFLAVATIIYTMGVDSAFLRYYILDESQNKRRVTFSTAFWTVLGLATGFSVFLLVGSQPIATWLLDSARYRPLISLSAGILFFDALNVLPFLVLRAEERSIHFAILKFANVVINLALNVVLIVWLKHGIQGIFQANLVASAATFVLLLPVSVQRLSPGLSGRVLRDLLRFGIPYLPSTLAVVLMDVIDRFILKQLAGFDVAGLYSAGYKLGTFMALFIAAFRFAWHPFFLSEVKKEGAKELFARVLTYLLLACFAVFLLLSFTIDDIVRLRVFGITIFGPRYWDSTVIVPTIMLAYIFFAAYLNFVIGIYTEKKSEYLPLVTGIGAGVNIISNYLLIPRFGMMGSAYATVLGYASMATALYVVGQKLYPVRYEWRRVVHLSVAAGLVFWLERPFHHVWPFWARVALVLVWPLGLWVTGFFKPEEKQALKAGMRKLLRR